MVACGDRRVTPSETSVIGARSITQECPELDTVASAAIRHPCRSRLSQTSLQDCHRDQASDGAAICRMCNQAIAGQALPKHLSSDNDPLFRFHRWRANLRILEIEELKTVPLVRCSHSFVERLIGTIQREYLDHILFWNRADLQRKLGRFASYYNEVRVHSTLAGQTPSEQRGRPIPPIADLRQFSWEEYCHDLFHTPIAGLATASPARRWWVTARVYGFRTRAPCMHRWNRPRRPIEIEHILPRALVLRRLQYSTAASVERRRSLCHDGISDVQRVIRS
jgi:hypothetical protein